MQTSSGHSGNRQRLRRRPYSVSGAIACTAGLLALGACGLVPSTKDHVGPGALALTVLVWTAVSSLCITGVGIGAAGLFKRGSQRLLPMLGIGVSVVAFTLFALQLAWPTTGTLLAAAHEGDLITVKRSVRMGVDVRQPGPLMVEGERLTVTPLTAAAMGGQVTISKLLISHGASVAEADNHGVAPLCVAVRSGHINLTRMLLQEGADANAACDGLPPLREAARHGSRDLVVHLLEHGAEIDGPAALALHDAAARRHAAVVKLLLERGVAADALDVHEQSALHHAAAAGHAASIRYLLEHGADPNRIDALGQTPLDLAAYNDHAELIEQLQAAGAEIDVFTAVAMNDPQRLTQLLESDPASLHTTRRGLTLLHEAARRGRVECADVLLAHKADLEASSDQPPYVTPLFLAVKHGHTAAVDLLLQHGADVDSTYTDQDATGPLPYFAILHDHEEIFHRLLAHDVDVDAMCQLDQLQAPPLHASLLYFAVRHDRRYAVEALIERGAKVNARPNNKAPTPLFEAVRHGDVELVSLLLDHRADPQAVVADQTPMTIAEARRTREPAVYDAIIQLLTTGRPGE